MSSLKLTPINRNGISKYLWEFQKRSKCFELPPDEVEVFGIFYDNTFIGYFLLQGFDNTEVEVNQGYLLKEFRHLGLANECIKQMEVLCKAAGYKRITLGTHNRFRSYLKFMKSNGYKPEHLIFSKELA